MKSKVFSIVCVDLFLHYFPLTLLATVICSYVICISSFFKEIVLLTNISPIIINDHVILLLLLTHVYTTIVHDIVLHQLLNLLITICAWFTYLPLTIIDIKMTTTFARLIQIVIRPPRNSYFPFFCVHLVSILCVSSHILMRSYTFSNLLCIFMH